MTEQFFCIMIGNVKKKTIKELSGEIRRKHIMKKLVLTAMLVAMTAFGLTACGSKAEEAAPAEPERRPARKPPRRPSRRRAWPASRRRS